MVAVVGMVGVLKIQNALGRLYSMVKHDFLENFGITGFGCSVFCVQNSCLDLYAVYYIRYMFVYTIYLVIRTTSSTTHNH